MRPQILFRFVSLALAVSCCRPGLGQMVFDDGQEHVLTEDIDQPVIVSNQSRLDVRAQMSGNLQVDDASVGLSTGGEIWGSASFDNNANLIVNGGGSFGDYFSADIHDSNVTVNSGYGPHYLDADGNSVVSVNGGSLGRTTATDASSVVCNGGSISTDFGPAVRLEDSATMQISDGSIWGYLGGMRLSGQSSADMIGGLIQGYSQGGSEGLVVSDSSVFRMSGGQIVGNDLGVGISDSGVFQMSGGLVEVLLAPEWAVGLSVSGSARARSDWRTDSCARRVGRLGGAMGRWRGRGTSGGGGGQRRHLWPQLQFSTVRAGPAAGRYARWHTSRRHFDRVAIPAK